MRRRTIRWAGMGWLAGALLVSVAGGAGAQPVLKTYLVDPGWLQGLNLLQRKPYESFIIGLHQGLDPARAPADPLYPYAEQARRLVAQARMPHNPFHSQPPLNRVWVRLEGALPPVAPGHMVADWRLKYYPPNPVPYGVTYAEKDPGGGVDPTYGDKAFDPADLMVKAIGGLQTYGLGSAAPALPVDHMFEVQPNQVGIGTIELQYKDQTDGRWYSVPSIRGGPVVVRFVVSPIHVRPQYASKDRSLDDTDQRILAGESNAHYPQLFNPLNQGGNLASLVVLKELVRPVFLIGYQRDEDQPPAPPYANGAAYYFPVAPGAKSPDKDFVLQYLSGASSPVGSQMRFEPIESPLTDYSGSPWAQRYFGPRSVILPFESLQFFAPRLLGQGEAATGTITTRTPSFQPPSADAFRREAQEAVFARDPGRYRGLVRLYLDEPRGGRANARWDALLFRWIGQRGGQPVVYEQFDRVQCEDPTITAPGLAPNPVFQVERYETFEVQVTVPIERALAVQEETVDVGKAVHGQATVSVADAKAAGRQFGRWVVENRGNVPLLDLKISPVHLYRTEVDTSTSLPRQMQTLPLTANTLLTDVPTPWQIPVAPVGSLSGSADERYLQVGWENVAALAVPTKRIAVGQPIGHYSGRFTLYEDLDGDGVFDAGEPFDNLVVKVRVVESPLMKILGLTNLQWFNALDSGEGFGTALLDPQRMWLVWSSNRTDLPPQPSRQWNQRPSASHPWNLFSVVGKLVTGRDWRLPRSHPLFDPNYRTVEWDTDTFTNLTQDTPQQNPYFQNLFPSIARDRSGNAWLFWHRQGLLEQGGVFSQLLYWRGGPGGSVITLPDSRLQKQAPRALVAPNPQNLADPNDNILWLFWHNASGGQARLFFNALRDNQGVVADAFSGQSPIGDYPVAVAGDLAYAKEVAPLPEFQNGLLTRVHLFYTGWSSERQNEDIYWSRYDPNRMLDPNYQMNGNLALGLPFGRLPFPRLANRLPSVPLMGQLGRSPGDQLEPNPTRDVYLARHPDWYVTPTLATNAPGFPQVFVPWNAGGTAPADPVLYVRQKGSDRKREDNGLPILGAQPITWDPDPNNSYFDRQRGEVVLFVNGPDFLVWRDENADGQIGADERRPDNLTGLRLRINPAAGTVRFSRPLYAFEDLDSDFVFQPGRDAAPVVAATIREYLRLTGAVSPEVLEVFADYTPITYRVTVAPASDASPTAVTDQFGRLFIAWRRSDEEGRSRLWYTTYSTAIQLNFPPVVQIGGVDPLDGGFAAQPAPTLGANNPGLIYFSDDDVGKRARVTYQGYPDRQGRTAFVEIHRVPGFSPEEMLPLDTVSSETQPFAVADDLLVEYDVADADRVIPASRFWLIWTAGRETGVELPNPGNPAPAAGDLSSSDLYFATLAPGFGVGSENAVSQVGGQP